MRIGIDYRPVTAAPHSGIARQVLALEQALLAEGCELLRFSMAPDGHPHRQLAVCPPSSVASNGLHRPRSRLAFELGFLPGALRQQGIDLYIATANSGLPLRRPSMLRRQVLLLHDVFQLTLPGRHASWLHGRVYGAMDRFMIGHAVRAADAIWTPSQFSADELARLYPRTRTRTSVLPNAVLPLAAPSTEPMRACPRAIGWWLAPVSRARTFRSCCNSGTRCGRVAKHFRISC